MWFDYQTQFKHIYERLEIIEKAVFKNDYLKIGRHNSTMIPSTSIQGDIYKNCNST